MHEAPPRRAGAGPWAAGCAVLFGLLATAQPAQACIHSSSTLVRIVGVGPDGSFVDYEDAMDSPIKEFTLRDARGHALSRLTFDDSLISEGLPPWSLKGSTDPHPLIENESSPPTVAEVEAELVRRYHLTPLRSSPLATRVPTVPKGCGPLLVRTPDGEVPVQDIGDISHDDPQSCTDIATQAFEHPASPFLFVRIRFSMPLGEGQTRAFDEVRWFSPTRLAGLRAAARGKKAMADRKLAHALVSFDEALRLAPEYMPARLWAAQALAASGASEAQAQDMLAVPLPDPHPCLGNNLDELRTWFDTSAPPTWRPLDQWPDSFKPWQECDPESFDLDWSHPDDPPTNPDGELPCPRADPTKPEPPPAPAPPFPLVPPMPVLNASPPPAAAWRADPRSALLGALGVAAFVAGYRRGSRRKR